LDTSSNVTSFNRPKFPTKTNFCCESTAIDTGTLPVGAGNGEPASTPKAPVAGSILNAEISPEKPNGAAGKIGSAPAAYKNAPESFSGGVVVGGGEPPPQEVIATVTNAARTVVLARLNLDDLNRKGQRRRNRLIRSMHFTLTTQKLNSSTKILIRR
jgi:hypothetical protein